MLRSVHGIADTLIHIYGRGQDEPMLDSPPAESAHILLIEDNPGDVRLTQEAFRSIEHNVEFHVITDGTAAITYVHRYLPTEDDSRPDIILLDLNLPCVDRFGILEMLDDKLDVPPPPVLILSSSAATDDVDGNYEKGCNAYLTKPGDLSEYTTIAESIKDFWLDRVRTPVPFS